VNVLRTADSHCEWGEGDVQYTTRPRCRTLNLTIVRIDPEIVGKPAHPAEVMHSPHVDLSNESGPHVRDARTDVLPPRWHVLRSSPESGVTNMATDLALLSRAADSGVATWRCYSWRSPTVSFGRNEVTRGRFDAASLARAGLAAVRRPTGGRALLHAREVTYSAAFPLAATVRWQDAYAAINTILRDALREIGVHATIVGKSEAAPIAPNGPLCFDVPAPGELSVNGAKLVGSAVWRDRTAFLQHGSILLHDDQALLVDAMVSEESENGKPRDDVTQHRTSVAPPPAASLHDIFRRRGLPCPSASDVAGALERALGTRADTTPFVSDPAFADAVARAHVTIDSETWLWRR